MCEKSHNFTPTAIRKYNLKYIYIYMLADTGIKLYSFPLYNNSLNEKLKFQILIKTKKWFDRFVLNVHYK